MKTPDYWGISGFPISHSLTPKLFEIVGKHLGLEAAQSIFLEANSIDELQKNSSKLEGDIWLSCTSPLKHVLQEILVSEDINQINSINQLVRKDGNWTGANTDGVGFVVACRHIGVEPRNSILKLKGGGSTARSIASSWASAGGKIMPLLGRRKLKSGHWDEAIVDSGNATLGIDTDTFTGESNEIDAELQVSISYDEQASPDQFAIIMLAAQHLEAWKTLFAPEKEKDLPKLSLLLKELI